MKNGETEARSKVKLERKNKLKSGNKANVIKIGAFLVSEKRQA